MNKSLSLRLFLCALGFGLNACGSMKGKSSGQNNRAIRGETASFEAPLAGCWEGRWISGKHPNSSGRLYSEMKPTGPGVYRARFVAQWHIFKTRYDVVIRTESRGGRISFEGAHELPAIFGGEYRYRGVFKGDRMDARYDSLYDFGALEMTRLVIGTKASGAANPVWANHLNGVGTTSKTD